MKHLVCLLVLASGCLGSDSLDETDAAVKGPVGIRALTLSSYDQRFWGDYPQFSGGVMHSTPQDVVGLLEEARHRHFRVWLSVVTQKAAPNNAFDRSIALDQINGYAGVDLGSYHDVLVGIYLIDEPQLEKRWGPGGVPMDVVDDVLARRAHQVFPGYPISVRLSPSTLEPLLPQPHHVDVAWGTYKEGRSGEVTAWMRDEHAAARRMGIGIEWTINAYRAPGDGPFISAAHLRVVGTAMAKDANSYGVNMWTKLSVGEDPVPELQTSAMRAALADVANAMVAKR